jgi:hypothetical protein
MSTATEKITIISNRVEQGMIEYQPVHSLDLMSKGTNMFVRIVANMYISLSSVVVGVLNGIRGILDIVVDEGLLHLQSEAEKLKRELEMQRDVR